MSTTYSGFFCCPSVAVGATGAQGPAGAAAVGGALDFADFNASMPGDNAATVAGGTPILFPASGPAKPATGITALGAGLFQIAVPGIYYVEFEATLTAGGVGQQVVVWLNGVQQPTTTAGQNSTSAQTVLIAIVSTIGTPNSVISIRNPTGAAVAFSLPLDAGGNAAVSAHFIILRLA